jgi:hypothetical protein
VEVLEPRALLSGSILGSFSSLIPSGTISSYLKYFPAYTNTPLANSLTSLTGVNAADQWWLQNTGQTLSSAPSGPATGTPDADIDATEAWNITKGSANVVVAVLDTGIDLNNPDLVARLWTNAGEIAGDGIDNDGNGRVDDVHGWNFLDNSNDLQDNFVHGTAVAGAILSVAPNVSILPVQIGTAGGASDADVMAGINYLIGLKKAGVNIVAVNASYISTSPPSLDLVGRIKAAGDAGMLFVAAAGNAGLNLDSLVPDVPSFLSKYIPSFLPSNMMFVAATNNQDGLAGFSDYGGRTVAIGAPGVDMTLPIPGGLYVSLSGTSFAAPMVSATAALLKSRVPSATTEQIKTAILAGGDADPALAGKTITGKRLNTYGALNYLMGQQKPTGAVTTLTNDLIEGWAFDPNLGTDAAHVQVSIDGVLYDPVPANLTRPELQESLGSADHGFSFAVPALAYGKHTVKVYAVDDTAGKTALIGQGTLTVNAAPVGAIDAADAKTISGWAWDSDTPGTPAKVKLYVDGKPRATATANLAHDATGEDPASANRGFSFKLTGVPLGIHRVDVYAVDTLTGAQTLIGTKVLSTNSPPTGALESATATAFSGWAFDADAGAASIQILYQIDDFAPVLAAAKAARADLVATVGSKNHGFTVALPRLAAGEHTLTVWAVDPKNKSLVQIGTQTITADDVDGNPLPTGAVIGAGPTAVSGWVFDASTPDGPVRVRVDVDGVAGTPFTADAAASDAGLDHPVYGFTKALALKPGRHRVDVYALDDATGDRVLIASRIVGAAVPTGGLDTVTATKLVGWAFGGGTSSQVRIDIDDLVGELTTTTVARGDRIGTTGAGKFGFSAVTPSLSAGEHTVTLYYIDPLTLEATVVGSSPLVIG